MTVSVYIDAGLAEQATNLPKGAISRITEEGLRLVLTRQRWRLTGDALMGLVIISLGGLFIVLSTLFVMTGLSNPLVTVSLVCSAVLELSAGTWVLFKELSVVSNFNKMVKEVNPDETTH